MLMPISSGSASRQFLYVFKHKLLHRARLDTTPASLQGLLVKTILLKSNSQSIREGPVIWSS